MLDLLADIAFLLFSDEEKKARENLKKIKQ